MTNMIKMHIQCLLRVGFFSPGGRGAFGGPGRGSDRRCGVVGRRPFIHEIQAACPQIHGARARAQGGCGQSLPMTPIPPPRFALGPWICDQPPPRSSRTRPAPAHSSTAPGPRSDPRNPTPKRNRTRRCGGRRAAERQVAPTWALAARPCSPISIQLRRSPAGVHRDSSAQSEPDDHEVGAREACVRAGRMWSIHSQ